MSNRGYNETLSIPESQRENVFTTNIDDDRVKKIHNVVLNMANTITGIHNRVAKLETIKSPETVKNDASKNVTNQLSHIEKIMAVHGEIIAELRRDNHDLKQKIKELTLKQSIPVDIISQNTSIKNVTTQNSSNVKDNVEDNVKYQQLHSSQKEIKLETPSNKLSNDTLISKSENIALKQTLSIRENEKKNKEQKNIPDTVQLDLFNVKHDSKEEPTSVPTIKEEPTSVSAVKNDTKEDPMPVDDDIIVVLDDTVEPEPVPIKKPTKKSTKPKKKNT